MNLLRSLKFAKKKKIKPGSLKNPSLGSLQRLGPHDVRGDGPHELVQLCQLL